MVNPTPGYGITTAYRKPGPRSQWSLGFHTGADLAGGKAGAKIVSATPGIVIAANAYDKSYGYKVIVRWGSFDVWYCHMPPGAAKVKVGQKVNANTPIGVIGSTGNVTGPHLHMELRIAGGGFAAANFRDPITAIKYASNLTAKWGSPSTWVIGSKGADVTKLGTQLEKWFKYWGLKDPYAKGPGPQFTETDRKAVAIFQKKQGWKGTAADGYPGAETFKRLAKNPPVKATPKPAAPVCTLHVGTLNVIAKRLGQKNYYGVGDHKKGLDYERRVPGFVKMQDSMGVSVMTTTESGTYAMANSLSKSLAQGWKNVLHGDNGDLTVAVHWHPKRTLVAEGKFTTAGTHHNWATWALLRDVKTGVLFLKVVTHLEYRATGKTSASQWDSDRRSQTTALVTKAQRLAVLYEAQFKVKDIPIVFSGDFNADDDDRYDTPGEVMASLGYVDCEKVASKLIGPGTTYNGLDPKKVTGRRLDRIFVRKGTKVGEMVTVAGYPNTDHNGVGVALTLTNG